MATRDTPLEPEANPLRRLAGLLQELFVAGGVVVTTRANKDDPEAPLAFSTLIQPDGDIIVTAAREHSANAKLWAEHLEEIRKRLDPIEHLRRWLQSANTYASMGSSIGRSWALGSLLLLADPLAAWWQTFLPPALLYIARFTIKPLGEHALRWLVDQASQGLPSASSLEGKPRAEE